MVSPSESPPEVAAAGSGESASQSPQWYTHAFNRPIVYRLVAACSHGIPRGIRLRMARAIAPVFQRLMPREAAAVRRNIAHILPHADMTGVEHTTCALFRHFACVFVDLLSLNRRPSSVQQRYVHQVRGLAHVQQLLAAPRGFVAATAHMGNWELAGRLLASFGRPLHILMAPEQHAAVQRLLRGGKMPPGLRVVTASGIDSFMRLLIALRRGDIVAIQADRATGHRGDVRANFFGAPAAFPSGPFTLAAAAGVPVLPCFCVMRPDERYDILVEQAIAVARGQEEAALQQFVGVLERHIAMAPEQWFNFYDVWNDASPTA